MLNIVKGVDSPIVLTLAEKQLISVPNFLFVFTGRTTNTQIKFVLLNFQDLSFARSRFNRFIIDYALFSTAKIQQYIYNVYEQESETNLDPAGLNLLETGIMVLREPTTVFTEPIATTEFTIL
jgi:hypothetical protein